MYDILIKNGVYPDFEKGELVAGDVALKDGKITALGQLEGSAAKTIDAAGCVVSPGFIDIHMHEEDFINEGKEYFIAELMLRMGVTTCMGGNCGIAHQSVARFKDVVSELGGAPVNYLLLAGYNDIRESMGISRYDKATPEQIEALAAKISEAVDVGAHGVSFGLEYAPGITLDEVMAVLKAQPGRDLFVSAHYRKGSGGSASSIEEMIRIAAESDKKFQISHLSSCSAMGQMTDALAVINKAVAENPRLDYDTYPYNALSTAIGTAVFDDGCFEAWGKKPENIFMTSGKYKNQYCTRETFEEIRRDDPEQYVVAFVMNEDEIAAAIANPSCGMVASDSIVRQKSGHPRAAGTFPRVLGKYVREDKALPLIDALRKMTLAPAKRLDLHTKGCIEVGCDGDLTIFDPETIIDGATFESLTGKRPEGIKAVIIAGSVAMENGEIINDRLGRFIDGPYVKK